MIGGREAHDRHHARAARRRWRASSARSPPPTRARVLVVMSSYPYVTPARRRRSSGRAHAGQETGRALADLLTGEHAFEGRLPQAWPAADADLPDALDYDIIKAGWTYQYATAPAAVPVRARADLHDVRLRRR